MASQASLRRSLRAYQIYGANTNVGKTIMSTILCKAFAHSFPNESTFYLKPVSTGPLNEADDGHVSHFSPLTRTKCLFQFDEAVSPHIAARSSTQPLSDSEVQVRILDHLSDCASSGPGTVLVETAGGVHSPTPSGSSQVDLYRPLRLPICLVADHKLGGISASISAFESLHLRGYDLDTILQFEDETYQNHDYLREYFVKKGVLSLSLPPPPSKAPTEAEDREILSEYYEAMSKSDLVTETVHKLVEKHKSRIIDLEEMSTKANNTIWYPFTQHRDVSSKTIMAIDSASGDFFQTHIPAPKSKSETEIENILAPTFDGSASWWTQGLGHGNPELSLAASYAAGRYGHVMFAGTVHAPALELATTLLSNLHNHRLTKCFFSDNGSTGMEVATKMAFTATSNRYGYDDEQKANIGVLGLKGSYHGDTIGAMDCSEPSTFNEKVHWYKGRGHWLDFPKVKCKGGKWIVEVPDGEVLTFGSLTDIFDLERRRDSEAARKYRELIGYEIERLVKREGMTFGALVMEPVILGAGGMLFVDPLFQQTLISVVRDSTDIFTPSSPTNFSTSDPNTWTGLPIVFDEVFTGLYRLGRFTPSSFLQSLPDISVHAKLLTGGLVPLCTTLASESIYEAFLGSEKRDALLHGHSYTAHPVGCHVANTSLKALIQLNESEEWKRYKNDWQEVNEGLNQNIETHNEHAWSVWSRDFVTQISHSQQIESVNALGSVLVINLQDDNAGYSSTAAAGLQKTLLEGSPDFRIHVRVLGNVLYIMASQTSKSGTLRGIEKLLASELL